VLDIAHDPPTQGKEKAWRWILIDSLIIACLTLVATLPETRPPSLEELYAALRAFFYALLLQLAVERGLKKVRKGRR